MKGPGRDTRWGERGRGKEKRKDRHTHRATEESQGWKELETQSNTERQAWDRSCEGQASLKEGTRMPRTRREEDQVRGQGEGETE